MFNSGILDVAIGIVFVYLLVSLIVTAANELIAALFKMRGRVLWQGICNLLPAGKGKLNIARQVYAHPLIAGLSQSALPSYIPSRTFTLTLLDVVSGGTGQIAKAKQLPAKIDLLPENLRRPLHLLLSESEDDLERFKTNIEVWFNDSMDRVSGIYKRKVHYALFFLGFVLAVALNVDTIVLANRLSHDSALRAALVSNAEAAARRPAPPNSAAEGQSISQQEAALATTIQQLNQLSLPIGWAGTDPDLSPSFATLGWWGGLLDAVRRHFVGWMLTALAATLGAPFWFDLLNRFINIRSAGKAPEEKAKDPKEVPLPAGPGIRVPAERGSAEIKTQEH
jgi:hypothetical protein